MGYVSSLEGSLPDIKKAAGVLLNQALLNFGLAFLRQRCLAEGRNLVISGPPIVRDEQRSERLLILPKADFQTTL